MMVSWGVNTLISDSGVIRYRMIAERWEVNTVKKPSYWFFDKGLYLMQFDEQLHIQAFIECDTAWYYDANRLWELKGRVRVRTTDGTRFSSEELYWNQATRKLYSYKYSKLVTPDNELEGTHFESDEPDGGVLNHYLIDNTKGFFKASDMQNGDKKDMRNEPDSMKQHYRSPASPHSGVSPAVITQPTDTTQH